ncbi:MAG: PEP-CTERM sorting domain-containing protein [Acidobacteria bacterium]|nr:PEP-CTERM sorting domain-containing protein [Acidobacteriota bacterium]
MKRCISTLCLLVGASVASYAGVISAITGNMTGPNGYLQNFDSPAMFPAGSFTSLPQFNATGGTLNTNVNIQAAGGSGSLNTGNTGSVQTGGNATFGLSGQYLNSYAGFPANTALSSNFVRTLTFTFSQAVSEFLFNYAAHDGTGFYTVNGLPTEYALVNQASCTANCTPASAGFVVDGSVTSISFFTITFQGNDRDMSRGGDIVFIDNLRLVGPANGTVETSGGGNVIPEPSTYALMGAGLLALGYARRKK